MVYDTDICSLSTLSLFPRPVDVPADKLLLQTKVFRKEGNDLQPFGCNAERTAERMHSVNPPYAFCKQ